MESLQSITNFLEPKKMAIAGVSRNDKKFSHLIYKSLLLKGYDVCPINPKTKEIDGKKCYSSIKEVPKEYSHLFIVTPKEQTDAILSEAIEKGIKNIRIQQSSETKNSLKIAEDAGVSLIKKECMYMYTEPVKGVHGFHRFLNRLFGIFPK